MQSGNFYFIHNDYFVDFPDKNLMQNSEFVEGTLCARPCFYAMYDTTTSIYWLIPLSSRLKRPF